MATMIDRSFGQPRRARARPSARVRRRTIISHASFVFFFFLMTVGLAPFDTAAGAIGSGSTLNQSLYVAVFLVMLLANGMPSRRELLCVPIPIAILLGYCALSLTWAIAPEIAMRRLAQTAIVIWLCFRFVNDLGSERLVRTLRWLFIALLALNYLWVFATPYGVHGEAFGDFELLIGDWHGILSHKNSAGAACAFTILLFLFDNRQFSRIATAVVVAAAANFLIFADSRTSMAMLMVGIVLGLAIRPYNANHRVAMAAFLTILTALIAQVLVLNSRALSDVINDPVALTGRGAIWPLLLEYARTHPLTGAGFGSFWAIGNASPIWSLTSGWVALFATHGHNGYLDLLVTIGIPGLVLAIAALVVWPLLRLLLSLEVGKSERSLLLALMTFCLGHNLSESTILNGAAAPEVILMLTIAMIYRASSASAGAHQRLRGRMRRAIRFVRRRPANPRGLANVHGRRA